MTILKKCASNFLIILNYNSWQDTIECIESLVATDFEDFQIILIDNNSTNDSQDQLLNYFNGKITPKASGDFFQNKFLNRDTLKLDYCYYNLNLDQIEPQEPLCLTNGNLSRKSKEKSPYLRYPIIFIQTGKNLGFAGGNNIGLSILLRDNRLSNTTKIMLLNPDTFIDSKALTELNKIDQQNFISGCFIKPYNDPNNKGYYGACKISKPFGTIKYLQQNIQKQIDYIYGGALFTNKITLQKHGILPESYFLYWEETDWCYNAKLAGTKLLLCEDAIVYDKIGTSAGRGYLAHYYFIRNGLWFYRKFFKKHIFTLLLAYCFRCIKKLVKLDFRNALAIVHGTKAYFRGEKGNAYLN